MNKYFSLIINVAKMVGDAVDDDQFDAGALRDDVALQTAHGLNQLLQRLQEDTILT